MNRPLGLISVFAMAMTALTVAGVKPASANVITDGLKLYSPALSINLPIVEGDASQFSSPPLYVASHYPGMDWPGQGGRSLLYAHDQPGMFDHLISAVPGEEIDVIRTDGTVLQYWVTQVYPSWPATDFTWVNPSDHEQLVLLTCTGWLSTEPRTIVVAEPHPAPPTPPVNVTASPGAAAATVSWSPPLVMGWNPPLYYTVLSSPGGYTGRASGGASSLTIALPGGITYTFQVQATNSIGSSGWSTPSNPVTPARPPDPPTAVTAMAGFGSASVSWTAPGFDGGAPITGYRVSASPGGATAQAGPTDRITTVGGLSAGVGYTFTVQAINAAGASGPSPSTTAVTPGLPAPGTAQVVLPTLMNGAYGGYTTEVYIQNVGSAPATVWIHYYDGNGNEVGMGDTAVGLAPNATFIAKQDNGRSFGAGAAGSGTVYADQPVHAFVNEYSPGQGDGASYSGVDLPRQADSTLYLPVIFNGWSGYTTGLGVTNAGSSPTTVTITYFNVSGALASTTVQSLPAHSYAAFYSGTAGLPAGFVGSAVVSAPGASLAAIVNEVGPGGQFSSYVAQRSASTLYSPIAFNNAFGGYYTGMNVQNTASVAGTLTVTYYDQSGKVAGSPNPIALPANGTALVYQGDSQLGPPQGAYSAVLTASGGAALAAVVNEVGLGLLTSINPAATGSSRISMPLLESADNEGRSTGLGVMNIGPAASVTLTYYDRVSGAQIGTPQTQTLAQSAYLPLYQPTAGLASGQAASGVLAGGSLVVVANEIGPGTLMSYVGAAIATPGSAASLRIDAMPESATGVPTKVTITARDASNLLVTSYAGTITLTGSDTGASVTEQATGGEAVFTVTHSAVGSQTVSAGDCTFSAQTTTTVLGPAAILPFAGNAAYGGYTTESFIENTGSSPSHLMVVYHDSGGALVGVGNLVSGLAVNGLATIRQDDGWSLSPGEAGSAIVFSDQPVASFVNEFAPHGGDGSSYTAVSPGATATTLFAPTILNNAYGGYTTGVDLVNTGSTATNITLTYYGASGPAGSGSIQGLAPGAFAGIYSGTAGLPAGFAGTVIVQSSAGPIAAIVNEVAPDGEFSSYDASASGSSTTYLPVLMRNAYGGYYTGAGVQNTAGTLAHINLTYTDSFGSAVKTVNATIAPYGYLGLYTGDTTNGPPAGQAYSGKLVSDQPVVAIVNEVGFGQLTSYNGFGSGSSVEHLPLVESNGPDGLSTGLDLMNTTSATATVTVTYFDRATGAPLSGAAPQTAVLGPGAFWGLYQPKGGLPNGVAATAVVTSTAQVVVICNEAGAGTLMSYSGT